MNFTILSTVLPQTLPCFCAYMLLWFPSQHADVGKDLQENERVKAGEVTPNNP